MSSGAFPPRDLCVDPTFVIANLRAWLEWVKEVTGYSDHTLAICLGTDARQVERWRLGRAVPSGPALAAIVLLAERIPGAYERLMHPGGRTRVAAVRDAATGTGDAPPSRPSSDRAA